MKLCKKCLSLQAGGKAFEKASCEKDCFLCEGGIYGKAERLLAGGIGALKAIEFSSFQVGTSLPEEAAAREELAWETGGAGGAVSLKASLNRRLAAIASEKTGARPELHEPDLKIVVDLVNERVSFEPQPIFIAGRYLKHSREISQSAWHCKSCYGRGCKNCGGKGKMYESVEEKIGAILLKAFEAEKTKFHASGREDVDARMLGTGRPFAIELVKPKKRKADAAALELAVNSINKGVVEVRELRVESKRQVEMLHNARLDKEYLALVELEKPEGAVEKIAGMKGIEVRQDTPTRVLHRRSDLERARKIKKIWARQASGKAVEIGVRAEAGTYIKEFVSGDNGRTRPSLSSILGTNAKVLELDVTDVERLVEDWW